MYKQYFTLRTRSVSLALAALGLLLSACGESKISVKTSSVKGPVAGASSLTVTNASPTNLNTFSLTYGGSTSSVYSYCILVNSTTLADCAFTVGALPPTFAVTGTDGDKTLSLWVKSISGRTSARVDSNTVVLDTTAPAVASFTVTNTTPTTATAYALTYGTITGTYASYCILENSTAVTGCTWTVGTVPATYEVTHVSGAKVLSLYLKDEAGNVSTRADAGSVTLNYTPPVLASAAITNTSPTRLTTYSLTYGTITGAFTNYCILENDTDVTHCTWTAGTSLPASKVVTATENAKVLSFYLRNAANQVSVRVDSNSVTLDTTAPATPTIALTATVSGSAVNTNVTGITVAITGDTDAAAWCLIEGLSGGAVPAAPSSADVCFGTPRPTAFTLTGRGLRALYAYTRDAAGNVSAAAGTDTLDFPLPSTIVVTAPSEIQLSACSDRIVIEQRDSYGLPSPGVGATSITPLSGNGSGTYYSDPACGSSITTSSIAGGSTSVAIYLKDATAESLTLAATGLTVTANASTTVSAQNEIAYSASGTGCAVINGKVQCLGSYGNKVIGDGTTEATAFATQIGSLTSKGTSVTTGHFNSCAVVDGSVYCWGTNYAGFLGNGGTSDSTSPVVIPTLTGAKMVRAGQQHTCAIFGEGVKCWGQNFYGMRGNGTTGGSNSPEDVVGLTSGVYRIGSGDFFSCALTYAGAVSCWGLNGSDVTLGLSSSTSTSLTPVPITGLESGVTGLAVGRTTACAILNGGAKCWGRGLEGQLGQGAQANSQTIVDVTGLTTGVTDISLGDRHGCAVKGGEVYCWGQDRSGNLGTGTIDQSVRTTATKIPSFTGIKRVFAGGDNTCAVDGSNVVTCWGNNFQGQLGLGVPGYLSVPQAMSGFLLGVTGLGMGTSTNCAILSDGRTQCWGAGKSGTIGDAAARDQSVPTLTNNIPSGATAVSVGDSSACAVVSGGLKCWGANTGGELGIGNQNQTNVPVDVPGLTSGVTGVALAHRDTRTCAIVSGGVECWGSGGNGKLGNGDVSGTTQPSPHYVAGLPASSGVTKIALGDDHACALAGGAVLCWGNNNTAQLGIATTTAYSATAVTAVASGATDISAGTNATCAVVGGAAQCWGYEGNGRLGNGAGAGVSHSTPVAVTGLSSGVTAITQGDLTGCALLSGGTVKCWGDGLEGKLGNGSTGNQSSPVTVVGLTGVTAISSGARNTCALNASGVYCWGAGEFSVTRNGGTLAQTARVTPSFVGSPAKLALTGPVSSTATACSTAFTVTLQNSAGSSVTASAARTVTLEEPGTGAYYANGTCTGGPITSVSIAMGASTASFYYLAPTAQSVGAVVRSDGVRAASFVHTVNP